MSTETLLEELRQLERRAGEDARASLLADLRAYPASTDSRRSTDPTSWKRGNVYFHSLQDTAYVKGVFADGMPGQEFVKACQACFVKDLDFYLEHFPPEEAEMRRLFHRVFRVGTSAYWEADKELLIRFNGLYWLLDREVIIPWVRRG